MEAIGYYNYSVNHCTAIKRIVEEWKKCQYIWLGEKREVGWLMPHFLGRRRKMAGWRHPRSLRLAEISPDLTQMLILTLPGPSPQVLPLPFPPHTASEQTPESIRVNFEDFLSRYVQSAAVLRRS